MDKKTTQDDIVSVCLLLTGSDPVLQWENDTKKKKDKEKVTLGVKRNEYKIATEGSCNCSWDWCHQRKNSV